VVIHGVHGKEENSCEENKRKKNEDPGDNTQSLATQEVQDPSVQNDKNSVDKQCGNSEILEEGGKQTDSSKNQIQLGGRTILFKVEMFHIYYKKIKEKQGKGKRKKLSEITMTIS